MDRTYIKDSINKIDQSVLVKGWVRGRRDHGQIIFIDLVDATGLLQIVFTPKDKEMYQQAEQLRSEWVVAVEGVIAKRPNGMVNENIPTGKIELQAQKLEILNQSETPPFDLTTDGYEVNEETRLRYRYLDLRRERLQKNIRLRHQVIQFIRNWLSERGFVEVETPILTKSTPEGARDYVVPSRIYPGNFYALPQSPQQYKQLLMVAGLEKYFQIARCFRDEDTRGDRQPEFTQLDLEMSFAAQEDILSLVESLYIEIVKNLLPSHRITKIPFPRLTHKEAMEKYNSDKPDLRTDKNDPNELAFAFVVDFPMFEWNEKEKRWDSAHHPFTMIKEEDLAKMETGDFASIKANSYDFVLNGYELASGSIRINRPEIQKKVFAALGLSEKSIMEKFGHMIEAFRYGAPPHGGIAPGIDRFVMLAVNEPNIREVIAFPKTGDARDPMMDSPSELDAKQLKELNLKIEK